MWWSSFDYMILNVEVIELIILFSLAFFIYGCIVIYTVGKSLYQESYTCKVVFER